VDMKSEDPWLKSSALLLSGFVLNYSMFDQYLLHMRTRPDASDSVMRTDGDAHKHTALNTTVYL